MSNSGLTVFKNNAAQFSTKYPAFMVDRTNNYGYRNYIVTFLNEPAYPPTPTSAPTTIYIPLFSIYHGLGYIPAFETVTIGYGLPPVTWNQGVYIWNEDALLSVNQTDPATTVYNSLLFRTDMQNLYITLFRESAIDYTGAVVQPPAMKGVQLNINTQIFAMGLNDNSSIVL